MHREVRTQAAPAHRSDAHPERVTPRGKGTDGRGAQATVTPIVIRGSAQGKDGLRFQHSGSCPGRASCSQRSCSQRYCIGTLAPPCCRSTVLAFRSQSISSHSQYLCSWNARVWTSRQRHMVSMETVRQIFFCVRERYRKIHRSTHTHTHSLTLTAGPHNRVSWADWRSEPARSDSSKYGCQTDTEKEGSRISALYETGSPH